MRSDDSVQYSSASDAGFASSRKQPAVMPQNQQLGASSSSHQQMRGEMGIFGQGQSIAGLAAAYALPPTIPPRTPNHDMHGQDSMPFGMEAVAEIVWHFPKTW